MSNKMKEKGLATPEQRRQIKDLLAEQVLLAFSHAVGRMSYAEAARIVAAPHGQLASFLEDAVQEAIYSIGNPSRFADEEITVMTPSSYGDRYQGARPVTEQLAILNRDSEKWGIRGKFAFTEEQKALLQHMDAEHLEGIFLMPPYNVIDATAYLGAVQLLLRNFWNISTIPFHLRGLEETVNKVHRLKDEWKRQGSGNLTLVWAQMGALYVGKSALRADELMLGPEEGGMGVYGFLSLLTTHPERLSQPTDPAAICSGDEIPIPGSITRESKVPVVSFFGDTLRFDTRGWDDFSVEAMVPSLRIPHEVVT